VLYWNDTAFQIEQAAEVTGPWALMTGAMSPVSVELVRRGQFFRLHQP
jgi:hypothetical protein